jgi:transcriptional regulator with XRE-family HTH domain
MEKNNVNNRLAINLINLRNQLGLTQHQFADSIEIKRTQYQGYENRRRKVPVYVAKRIIDTYKITDVYKFLFEFYEHNK